MADIIPLPRNVHPNKTRPHDRADDVADALIAEMFRHIWDETATDLDVPALSKKIAVILRIEFAHAAKAKS
jgi:hypothetical protein